MGDIWVFTYGSNMNLEDLQCWIENRELFRDEADEVLGLLRDYGKRAVLEDYRLCWNYYSVGRCGGAANVERASGQRVYGVAFRAGQRELDLFDVKEGHPRYYRRGEQQPVTLLDNGEVRASVYVARPNRPEPVWPTAKYKAVLLEGARSWDLPQDYIATLETVPTKG